MQYCQKYIIPKGSKHENTYHAGFVRVVYHTRAVRVDEPHLMHPLDRKRLKKKVGQDPIANYGFRVRNRDEILSMEAKGFKQKGHGNQKKGEKTYNLDNRAVVSTGGKRNCFQVYPMRGKSLVVYERMCNQIV